MINRYEARVERWGRGGRATPWLRLGRGRLAARAWPGVRAGARVTVRIRPEDVVLCAEHPGRVSARNVLPGRVRRLRPVPEGVYVTVDAGFALTALVTRRAAAELGLRPDAGVFALVKAAAVVPETEVRPRFRVSVEGPRGRIEPDRIDLLRAIDLGGSLTAAAREAGVTYRTAWLWAEACNRAWGAPLVARVRGGRGGGGAVLTPQGRALLDRIARAERAL